MFLPSVLAVLPAAIPVVAADYWDELKSSLCEPGDLDGDGIPDIVVGSRDDAPSAVVWALSGRDGRILWQLSDAFTVRGLGASLAIVGDIDADGVNEICIGAHGRRASSVGRALLVSGATGSILFAIESHLRYASFGASVACAGDIDGDGSNDLAVASPERDMPTAFPRLYSGRDGHLLLEIIPPTNARWIPSANFGSSMCSVGDFDGDGLGDVAVTDPGAHQVVSFGREATLEGVGCVAIVSGRTGTVLCTLFGERPSEALGWMIAPIADVDYDGRADLCVTGLDTCAKILSGADLSEICPPIELRAQAYSEGGSFTWIDDLDDDGRPDLAIGANDSSRGEFFDSGFVAVYSTRTGKLVHVPYSSGWSGVEASSPGDLDGDGRRDLVLSIVGPRRYEDAGHQIRALSSRTGKPLFDVYSGDLRRSAPSSERAQVSPR